jgi:cytochrome P450
VFGFTMQLMSSPPGPPAAAQTEFDLLGALFSPAGRADPHVILRGSPLPGCQHLLVRDVLRDPRFAAAAIPPSPHPAFQLLARWMIRLDGDRHRRVRDAFGGLFTARRVGRYRAIVAERAAALIDQVASAGSMELVAGFARPLPFAVINDVLGVPPGDRDWLGGALAVLTAASPASAMPTAPRSWPPTTRPSSCSPTSPGCSTSAPQPPPMT